MNKLSGFDWLLLILVIVGGLNWGLVGIFGFNLVDAIFGELSTGSRVVYGLVGIASVLLLVMSPKFAKRH